MRSDSRPSAVRSRVAARALSVAGVMGMLVMLPSTTPAQPVPDLPQLSPKARVEQRIGLTDFAVEYFSPGVKDRKIWGGLVPYEELWRTGANAPTTFKASRDFTFGGTPVPAGTYVLLSIPGKKSWTVILNSNLSIAGTRGYDTQQDVARVTVKPGGASFRERMAFLFADTTDTTSRLDLEWEKVRVSVPIGVDTYAHARANIDKAVDEAWRPHFLSARWLLDNQGDLTEALGYIDTSIAIKATWWNHWIKAQILAKSGRPADAVAVGEKAQSLGAGDYVYEGFFKDEVAKKIAEWRKS